MSRAKDLLKAGLDNKPKVAAAPPAVRFDAGGGGGGEEMQVLPNQTITPESNRMDLESVLKIKQPRVDRTVKRTFEMRESHVEILDKVVRKAKANGKRITQSDALQFILGNWNERFGNDLLD